MIRILSIGLVGLVIGAAFTFAFIYMIPKSPSVQITFSPTQVPHTITPIPTSDLSIIGSIPYWDQKSAFTSYREHASSVDYITLFWYGLRADGSIKPYTGVVEDDTIITTAHTNGSKVLALVANLPDYTEKGDWDASRVDKVISTPEARKKHIEDIVAMLSSHDFDGIAVDYEALKKNQRDNYTAFIKDLSEELHKKNMIVSLPLHHKTAENNPSENNGSWAQDVGQLARYADQLHLMGYDYHNTGTGPGPQGPLPRLKETIEYMISQGVTPKKLYLGVALDVYKWTRDTDEDEDWKVDGMTYAEFQSYLEDNAFLKTEWDEETAERVYKGNDYSEYTEAWVSDADSVKARIDLAAHYGLGGVLFWRLGGEDEKIWEVL